MDPKSGFKSSEFALALMALAIPAISTAFQGSPNPWISLTGMVLAGIYATLRHQLKLDAQQQPDIKADAPTIPVQEAPVPTTTYTPKL